MIGVKAAAVVYAARGWRVFPMSIFKKNPTSNCWSDATAAAGEKLLTSSLSHPVHVCWSGANLFPALPPPRRSPWPNSPVSEGK